MKLISNFKRAGYLAAASTLLLTAMPVNPIVAWLVNGGGSDSAYADDTVTEVSTCDELTSALVDDNAAIKLTANLSSCSPMEISKAKVIDGNGYSIVSTGDGAHIMTNEAVEFDNIIITATGYGISIPSTSNATATNITLDGVTINATERGFSYFKGQEGASLIIKSSTIQNSNLTNYDSDWYGNYSRGINFVSFLNSTVDISDTIVQGFQYDINMTAYSMAGSTLNFSGLTLKGWTGFNMWQTSAKINVSDTQIYGINKFSSGGYNSFSDSVLNNDGTSIAAYNTISFNKVKFNSVYVGAALGNDGETQWMFSDLGHDNYVTFDDCDFSTNLVDRTIYAILEYGYANITINSGTYDLPMEDDYLADGKVNYLVNDRYVVDDAPTSDLLPSRVMFNIADGGTYTFSDLANDTIAKTYGTTEAHYGSVSGTPTLDLTTGVLTAPVTGYGAANLTYNIKKINNDEIVSVTSYNEKVLFDAYSISGIDDQYVQVGSTIDDLEIEAEMSKYSTSEFTRYAVSTGDDSIATISANDDGTYTVTGVAAGTTKVIATITDVDSTVEPQTVELGNIYVWNFDTTGNETRYDIEADSGVATLKASEAYGQDAVACYARQKSDTDWAECGEFTGLTITSDDAGNYTVTGAGTANSYRVKFIDTINGTEVAATDEITIVAHKIALSGDDIEDGNVVYLTSGSSTNVTAKSKYVKWDIQTPTVTTVGDVTATVTDNGSGSYTIEAEGAGIVTVEFTDGVATETLTLYVVDFTVDATEYHLTSDNQVTQLINAINEYWETTDHGDIAHNTGAVTTKIKLSKVSQGSSFADGDEYDFTLQDGVKPDRYTLTLYALVGSRVVDQKDVSIYVYEMVAPDDDEFYGEVTGSATSYTFKNIKVSDRINRVLSEKPAAITAKVTSGDSSKVTIDNDAGTVVISAPGYYEVTYTDTMDSGNGDVAGTYTAKFKVYGLSAEAENGAILSTTAHDLYTYTIDPTATYGLVRTTITQETPDGTTTEISREEHRYTADSTAEKEIYNFDPADYGEGKYTVKIQNLSAKNQGFTEVVEGSFYAVAREYDFLFAPQGRVLEITSNSDWSVDAAYDDGDALTTLEDGVLTLDTSELSLGMHYITLVHDFDGEESVLKTVWVSVYAVVPDAKTDSEKITKSTLEELFDTLNDTTIDDDLTDKLKEMFGEEYLSTLVNLESAIFIGEEIDTRVEVTEIAEDEAETELVEAVAELDVDHVDYYDVSVLMEVNGYKIGKLHKLNGKLTVALAEATDPATGYARQYFVLRDHNGTVTVLTEGVDYYIEDGVIYVISDEFSTYAVAYKDTLIPSESTPNTGAATAEPASAASSNLVVALAATITAVTLAGAAVVASKRR